MSDNFSLRVSWNNREEMVQMGQWKKAILDQAGTLLETNRGRQKVDDQAGPERLYSEIGRLKMELDWLKNVRTEPVSTRRA
jgi:hypothetical protein